jgi:kynureninase
MSQEFSLEYARALDAQDPLKEFRDQFYFPKHKGEEVIYFTGNSLGLQPKTVASYIQQELDDWANLGVEGHFHAKHPWMLYHEFFTKQLADLVGAKETEVVAMNQLTVNIHLLLASFYRPTKERYKIICEAKAFPSDQYALESQVRHHGLNPEDAIIEVIHDLDQLTSWKKIEGRVRVRNAIAKRQEAIKAGKA